MSDYEGAEINHLQKLVFLSDNPKMVTLDSNCSLPLVLRDLVINQQERNNH